MDTLLERITVNPSILSGKPIIRGMRITVERILSLLAQGATQEEIIEDLPMLEPDDIKACIAYAHYLVAGEEIYPLTSDELRTPAK